MSLLRELPTPVGVLTVVIQFGDPSDVSGPQHSPSQKNPLLFHVLLSKLVHCITSYFAVSMKIVLLILSVRQDSVQVLKFLPLSSEAEESTA